MNIYNLFLNFQIETVTPNLLKTSLTNIDTKVLVVINKKIIYAISSFNENEHDTRSATRSKWT